VLISSGSFWLEEGNPTIPQLEGKWWGGYYDTIYFGRTWCVARFFKGPSGRLKMALLSPFGEPEIFKVDRDTSNEHFVYLKFVDPAFHAEIDGKQLYEGERYYLGRLLAGRFSDFWMENDDIRILGYLAPRSARRKFAIEPIGEKKLKIFWLNSVRPKQPTPSPADILTALGIHS
jgi:hypothetical protein